MAKKLTKKQMVSMLCIGKDFNMLKSLELFIRHSGIWKIPKSQDIDTQSFVRYIINEIVKTLTWAEIDFLHNISKSEICKKIMKDVDSNLGNKSYIAQLSNKDNVRRVWGKHPDWSQLDKAIKDNIWKSAINKLKKMVVKLKKSRVNFAI